MEANAGHHTASDTQTLFAELWAELSDAEALFREGERTSLLRIGRSLARLEIARAEETARQTELLDHIREMQRHLLAIAADRHRIEHEARLTVRRAFDGVGYPAERARSLRTTERVLADVYELQQGLADGERLERWMRSEVTQIAEEYSRDPQSLAEGDRDLEAMLEREAETEG